MEKVKTSISIDKNLYDMIKSESEREDRSFSQQLNKILKEFLAEREN